MGRKVSKDPGKEIGFIPPTTPRERELARRAVAAHALDPTDAAIMLAALGLDKEDN
mgnify:CR=1 FL=1